MKMETFLTIGQALTGGAIGYIPTLWGLTITDIDWWYVTFPALFITIMVTKNFRSKNIA